MRATSLLCSALAAALGLFASTAIARDLPPIDALADAARLPGDAQADLRQDPRIARAHYEERLGVPTLLWLQPDATATKSRRKLAPAVAARAELKRVADLYRISATEIDATPVQHVQALGNGAQLVKFTGRSAGIDVFREQAGVLLDADGNALAIGGYLGATGSSRDHGKAASGGFLLTAEDAIAIALGDYGFTASTAAELAQVANNSDAALGYRQFTLPDGRVGADGARLELPARAKQVWFRLPNGLVPGWYVEVQISENNGDSAYGYVVAADDGRLLFRNDQQNDATAFGYRAWAEDSALGLPYPGPQGRNGTPHPTGIADGYQAPLVPSTLLTRAHGPIASGDPWLADDATRTIGNNAEAWANLFGTGTNDGTFNADPLECDMDASITGDFHACISAPGMFDYTYDTRLAPNSSKRQIAASVVNLFYMNNWLHDWYYDAGFNEAAGNAQVDNYGRGGVGNDSIRAQAQDFSGTNNANMQTPADGARPRMRMYVFTGTGGVRATVNAPARIAGAKAVGIAAGFGAQNFELTGTLVLALDDANATGPLTTDGCTAFTNAAAVAGKIALIDRGTCGFAIKAKNAQNAGAVGVVIANNAPTLGNMSGADPSVTIPAVLLAQASGTEVKAQPDGTVEMRLERVTGVNRDGTLDNAIIAHEWGHYISNRLIGNASGLNTNHSRGMGEGWGDFHALMMMVKEEDALAAANADFNGVYGAAGYTSGGPALSGTMNNGYYFGIRRYPYSTDMAKNPLTFKHIMNTSVLPVSPPPAFTGTNAQVHNTGEVWASMLWECYSSLLRDSDRLSFTEAQTRMKRYLVAGYKLTPVSPTFVEARDALLAAIAAEDSRDLQLCAAGFAKRGLGQRAVAPDRFSTDNAGVVESYVAGGDLAIDDVSLDMSAGLYCDTDGFLDNGETGQVVVTVRNSGTSALTGATLALASPTPGMSFPAGAVAVLPEIAPYQTIEVRRDIKLSNTSAMGTATVYVDVNHPDQIIPGTVSAVLPLYTHRDVAPAQRALDDVEPLPSAWTVTSGGTPAFGWERLQVAADNHRWFGVDADRAGVTWLTSPALDVGSAANFTISFQHRHNYEFDAGGNYDGGVIEISTDGGTTWADLNTVAGGTYGGGTLLTYTGNLNPLQGRTAYVKTNAAWPALDTVTFDLGAAFAGQTVRIRFGSSADNSLGAYGWELDDIAFGGLAGMPFPAFVPHAGNCQTATSTTALVSSANPAAANASVTFTATVAGSQPGGTVSFLDDATAIVGCSNRPLSGSGDSRTATCTTSALAVGSHTIRANYAGDARNSASTVDVAQVIGTPAIVLGAANPADGTYAAPYSATLSATGGVAAYSYAVTAGALPAGVTLAANGMLSGTPTAVGAFAFTVTAQDSSAAAIGGPFTASQAYTLTIGKRSSTTQLTSNRAVVGSGAPLTLTATVAGTAPTGTVDFTDGGSAIAGCTGVALTNGTATCATSTLADGSRSLQAAYAGDGFHQASNGGLTQAVDALPTIAAAASATVLEDHASAPIAITIGDAETAADALIVSATSSDQSLVTNGSLAAGFGGSGASRTLTITPVANANGTATITMTVRDALGGSRSTTLSLDVTAVNDAPTFSTAGDRTHAGGSGDGKRVVPGFIVQASAGPGESTQALSYAVSELSDTRNIVEGVAIAADGTLTYTLSGNNGTARIRVVAQDDGGTANGGSDQSAAREFAIAVTSAGDISVSIVRTGGSGNKRSYEIRVRNEGLTTIELVELRSAAMTGVTDWLWTCGAPTKACTVTQGDRAVDTAFDLPPGAQTTIELLVNVDMDRPFVEISAQGVLPAGMVTLQQGDDRALFIEAAGPLGVMKSGFE